MNFRLRQRDKNIVLYIFSIILIAHAVIVYSLKDSLVDLSETVSEGIELLKTPEELRAKYTSQETYLIALEGQLLTSIKNEKEKWIEDIEFYENMFSLLLVIGGVQIIVLVLPTRSAE